MSAYRYSFSMYLSKSYLDLLMISLVIMMTFFSSTNALSFEDPIQTEDLLFSSAGFAQNQVSAFVIDLSQKKDIYSLNEDKLFIPASVSKIFTAIALMKHYGLDHQFETKLFGRGKQVANVFKGDFILKGAADPSLEYEDIENLAKFVKSNGILNVSGKFYFDDSLILTEKNISTYFGLLDVYNPAISAFNFNCSRIPVTLKKSNNQYQIYDQGLFTPNFRVNLKAKLLSSDPLYSYNGDTEKSVWNVNLNHAIANYNLGIDQLLHLEEIPMLSPSHYFNQMFFKNLNFLIPSLSWTQLSSFNKVVSSDKFLGSIKGRTIRSMMEKILLNSDNSYVEMLSARLASDLGVKVQNLDKSAKFMMNWWEQKYPSINLSSAVFKRSSGLTPKNYLTSRQLVEVLETFHYEPIAHQEFFSDFLPVSGVRGELKDELDFPATKGKIFAKSGYLSYVRALSGYMITQKGRKLAFSIMINDFDQRDILNNPNHPDFAKAVANAEAWATKSKSLRDALLVKWATEN